MNKMNKKHHLQEVQRQCRVACPAAGGETVGKRADVQQIGHAHWHYLAELPVERVRPPETKLRITAGGAGEPGEEGGGREEDLREMTSSVHLKAFTEDVSNTHLHTCPSVLCVQTVSKLYRHRARAQPYW